MNKIENNHESDKEQPTFLHILKRMYDFSELWGDSKVNFDQFLELIKKSMNMR